MKKKKVKFFQITATAEALFGLDSEGQVWKSYPYDLNTWHKISSPEVETTSSDESVSMFPLKVFPPDKL